MGSSCSCTSSKEYDTKNDLIFLLLISLSLLVAIVFQSTLLFFNMELAYFLFFYLLIALPVLKNAFKSLIIHHSFDENVLMTIATIGAFTTHQLAEALGVMLFYRWGTFFEQLGERKSQRSIESLMNLRPDVVCIKREGQWLTIPLIDAKVGDLYLLKTGERSGLDAFIEEGSAAVDSSALTGESQSRHLKKGDKLLAGMIITSGVLEARAVAEAKDSSLERIMQLTREALSQKSTPERFVKRFAKIYSPLILILSLFIALVPPLVLDQPFISWLERALILLVISCPCALVVSVPLAYFSGIGLASKHGLLFKGSHYLDAFRQCNQLFFDKTGTLTEGHFKINYIETIMKSENDFLTLAHAGEYYSNHAIAQAVKSYPKSPPIIESDISNYKELGGLGIVTLYKNKQLLVGNQGLLNRYNISYPTLINEETQLLLAYDGLYRGSISISDQLKPTSIKTVAALIKRGVDPIMLSGDRYKTVARSCNLLSINHYYAELLPDEKLLKLQELMASHQGKSLYVGDGINDTPSLAFADIGLAMGAGSDSALATADVVLLTNDPYAIIKGMAISKATAKVVRQNIIIPLIVKIIFVFLGVFGVASMWSAVFADTGVLILAILNSLRLFTHKIKP